MVNRIEIIPLEVRGYGNIIIPKTSSDFIGKYNEVYTNIDGDFVLSYGGVMLKITSNVSNTIKGLTAGLNVIVTTRDGGVPVSGLTVDCSIDEVSLTSETTDSNGECSFNWTPQIVGDSVILLTITAQDDYAGLTETKEITIGLLLSFNNIMNDLRLEDDEVYIADITQQVESRTQLNPFVKDVWVAEGGEPIVDEYGIIHIAEKGDLIVEQDSLDQSLEYDNVIFEDDVELLTGAVYDMELSEDYELIVNCLEREDIIGASGISLTASQTSVTYGSSVTLTATVMEDDTPVTGETVTFYDGETSLGTDTTDGDGVATLSTSSLSIGSHSCTAVYDEKTSNSVSVTVNKLASTISLTVPASGTVGTAYTVTGTLVPSTGSVKLYENGSLKDTLTVSSGTFSKAITQSNEGTYSYYAVFEGSSTYESVTSSTGSIVVSDVPTPSYDGVSLTSDKSILSYADSDSCTLTAQLLDGSSSASVSGVTVEFFKGSTSLGTATTNSSGVATKTYSSTGAGDVSLTASAGTFVSETYSIEDCSYYNTSEVSRTTTQGSTIYDNNLSQALPSKYEISLDVWSNNTSNGEHRFFIMPKTQYSSGTTQPQYAIYFDLLKNNQLGFGKRENNSTQGVDIDVQTGVTLQTYHTIKYVKDGTSISAYIDGSLKGTFTLSWIGNYSDYTVSMMRWSSSGTSKIKNVKFKPL